MFTAAPPQLLLMLAWVAFSRSPPAALAQSAWRGPEKPVGLPRTGHGLDARQCGSSGKKFLLQTGFNPKPKMNGRNRRFKCACMSFASSGSFIVNSFRAPWSQGVLRVNGCSSLCANFSGGRLKNFSRALNPTASALNPKPRKSRWRLRLPPRGVCRLFLGGF